MALGNVTMSMWENCYRFNKKSLCNLCPLIKLVIYVQVKVYHQVQSVKGPFLKLGNGGSLAYIVNCF